MLFNKSKILIKTPKTLLHVSIIRSSSDSILCSLLKLQFKHSVRYFVMFLYYNFIKAQSMLPEDDLVFETCRNVLVVLM